MAYQNLKALRESLSMSQKDFAASIGIRQTTYNGYETGAREPKSDFWITVAEKYGVTIDYLMGFSNDPHRTSSGKKITPLYSSEAMKIAKDFDTLDSHGQSAVRGLKTALSSVAETRGLPTLPIMFCKPLEIAP